MATPSFVNSGSLTQVTTATATVVPGNPASLVNGNLLICVVRMNSQSTSGASFSMPAGWTALWSNPNNQLIVNTSWALFWKITNGTEGTNTVTASKNNVNTATYWAQIHQFTGNLTSGTPVGLCSHFLESSSSETTQKPGGIYLESANSLAVAITINKSGAPSALATGWTERINNATQTYMMHDSNAQVAAGYSADFWYTYGAAFRALDCMRFGIKGTASVARAFPYIKQIGIAQGANAVTTQDTFLPQGLTTGNVLLLLANGGGGTNIPSAPGYKTMRFNGGSSLISWFLWRVIDGTEGTSVTVTWSGAVNALQMFIEIGNCDTTNPISIPYSLQAIANSTTQAITGFTTLRPNVLACSLFGTLSTTIVGAVSNSGNTWTRIFHQSGNGMHCSLLVQEVASAGTATGDYTNTAAATANFDAFNFEINPPNTSMINFVNAGLAVGSTTSPSSITPGNPTDLVAGNLLIALCTATETAGNTIFSAAAGWNGPYATSGTAGGTVTIVLYWKITTGTEGANAFSKNNTNAMSAQIFQFNGNDQTTPIGRISAYFPTAVATTQYPGRIVRRRQNSCVVAFIAATSGALPTAGTLLAPWSSYIRDCIVSSATVVNNGVYLNPNIGLGDGYSDDLTFACGSTNAHTMLLEILRDGETDNYPTTPVIDGFGAGQITASATAANLIFLPPERRVGDIIGVAFFPSTAVTSLAMTGYNIHSVHDGRCWLAWKVCNGTEADIAPSATWTTSAIMVAKPFVISNADHRAPFRTDNATTDTNTDTSVLFGNLTTVRDNAAVLSLGQHVGAASGGITGTGLIRQQFDGLNTHFVIKPMAAIGASGGGSQTIASAFWVTLNVEVDVPWTTLLANQAVIVN